jgi:carboxyl-terminal processing protease
MHKLFRCAVAFVAVACLAFAQDSFDAEQKKLLMASFEMVWATLRDKHYDPKLGGLDWVGIHEQYRPRIESAASMDEGRKIMNEMLKLLKQSHVEVISASHYRDMQEGGKRTYGPGIDVRVLDGKAIAARVVADWPADKAGVKPGCEILKIDGKEAATIIKRAVEIYPNMAEVVAANTINALIMGMPDNAVEIEFNDGSSDKTLLLDRARPKGTLVDEWPGWPASYFWIESYCTDDGIRIISFNSWRNPEAFFAAFSKIMADAGKAKGFIVDLRGNKGGRIDMLTRTAAWFATKRSHKFGTWIRRGAKRSLKQGLQHKNLEKIKIKVYKHANATKAPLAILVDGHSFSASEMFAGGMQDIKRARIFGTQTVGQALESYIVRLPNDDRLQYIVANYLTPAGKQLEGIGVTPDEIVKLTQSELLAGKDPVLDRAVPWIKSQK